VGKEMKTTLLFLMLLCPRLYARLVVYVCNTGNTPVYVAKVQAKHGWLRGSVEGYESSGWDKIDPIDDCGSPFFGYKGTKVFDDNFDDVYLAFLYHFMGMKGTLGQRIEAFCVNDAPYDISAASKEEMQDCKGSDHLYPFTKYVEQGGDAPVIIEVTPQI
jgi:hypothetical protein